MVHVACWVWMLKALPSLVACSDGMAATHDTTTLADAPCVLRVACPGIVAQSLLLTSKGSRHGHVDILCRRVSVRLVSGPNPCFLERSLVLHAYAHTSRPCTLQQTARKSTLPSKKKTVLAAIKSVKQPARKTVKKQKAVRRAPASQPRVKRPAARGALALKVCLGA